MRGLPRAVRQIKCDGCLKSQHIGHKECLAQSLGCYSEPSTRQTSLHPVCSDTGDFSQLKTIKTVPFSWLCLWIFFFLVRMLTPTNFLSLFFHKISNWKWTFLFFVIISAQRWFSKAVGLLRIGELCLSQAGVVFNSLHHSNTGGVAGLCMTRENRIFLSTTNDHSLIQSCYTPLL